MTVISPNRQSAPTLASDRAVVTGLPRWIAAATLLFSAVLFFAFATHGTFNPLYQQIGPSFADDFFAAQAHSIVHGHLTVNPAQIPGECWVRAGRCYGYFGLTPSVLRLPFIAVLPTADESLTVIYLTVALLLAVGSALMIMYRALRDVRRTRMTTFFGFALAFALGPASVLLMLARPAMYEESIAWATAFGVLGIYCFLRWWSDRRWGWGAALVASMVLGANARPTIVPMGIVLGAGIILSSVIASLRSRRDAASAQSQEQRPRPAARDRRLPWREIALGLAVAIVPVATACGIYWLKFRAVIPSPLLDQQVSGRGASPYWLALRHVNHNSLSGLRFVPTDLLAYIRPDGLVLNSAFPFVDFRFGTTGLAFLGIPPGSILPEPWSTVPNDMALAVVVIVAGFWYEARRRLRHGLDLKAAVLAVLQSPVIYCIGAGFGAWLVTLTQCGIANRYLGDAVPLVVFLVAVGARSLAPAIGSLTGRRAVVFTAAVTIGVIGSLLVNVGLEYQDWWHTV